MNYSPHSDPDNQLQLESPAKLNLMLHITGRREDGFHLLQTVFQFIDLSDQLLFQMLSTNEIKRISGNEIVDEENDLCVKAARLLQQKFNVGSGISISIKKNIPIGGGLGGGSSNAATTLMALNKLWKLRLNQQELMKIGLQLGADVPIFIYGQSAWASGVGEQLESIELPECWYLVIYPNIFASTGEIFNADELTRDCLPITIRAFLQGAGSNVCQAIACKLYPEIGLAMKWLDEYAQARMTGTGACVFAAFQNQRQAEVVKTKLPQKWAGFVVQAMNINPVTQQLLNS